MKLGDLTAKGRALAPWRTQNSIKHLQLSDFRRQMLPSYDALGTDEKSPIFRYPKRAYFIIDRSGVVKFMKIMNSPLDLYVGRDEPERVSLPVPHR